MSVSTFKEKDLQQLVGNILRWGVIIAMTIVIIGFVVYIFQKGTQPIDYSVFNPVRFQGFAHMMEGLSLGRSESIIQTGVLLLIATPIARIVFAMIGYGLERDRLYVIISLIILAIITFSIIYGAVE